VLAVAEEAAGPRDQAHAAAQAVLEELEYSDAPSLSIPGG
jgi:hypothetical protein